LLLLLRLDLLVLLILLILLVLLLLRLLVSYPRKGRIPIIFSMSQLASSWMLHHVPGTLLSLMLNLCQIPGKVIIPATTSRAWSLPGRIVLADTLVADMPVTFASISLRHRLLSGDCRIIHLDLLVSTARGYTSDTSGVMMRGQGLAPRPRTGTTHRRNILRCVGT
jgi:hypothetical protein